MRAVLQRGGGKAGGDGGKAERQRKAERPPARQERDRNAGQRQRRRRPPGRFALGGEIADDAEAEGDRQPGHQPAGRDFGQRPLRQQRSQSARRIGSQPAASARRAGARRRSPPPRLWRAIGCCSGPAMAPPRRRNARGAMLRQPQVVARRTVVNLVPDDGQPAAFSFACILGKGVAQADGAVEHRPAAAWNRGSRQK